MTDIDVHLTTRRLRDALGDALTRGDDEADAPLLLWLDGAAHLLGRIDDLARDTDERTGWVWLLHPDDTPREWLAWLGQLVGVRLLDGLDETSQRLRVRETAGQKRGTVAAIRGAARQHLTGTRLVRIDERRRPDGTADAYHLIVTTYTAETPDPPAVAAALQAEKPGGLILHYEVRTGATYNELAVDFATYNDLSARFADYDAMRTYVPGEG